MLDAQRLVGLLAAPARRRVIAALILGSGTAEDVAARSDCTVREATEALVRLEQADLAISGSDGTWVILDEAFAQAARSSASPAVVTEQHADQPEAHRHVLNQSIVDGRIVQWPTKRAKRVIVLDYLAQSFEPGEKYSEAQVNAILRPFHDDMAMLRRWLVDEYYLDRADGLYWRSGGRVG